MAITGDVTALIVSIHYLCMVKHLGLKLLLSFAKMCKGKVLLDSSKTVSVILSIPWSIGNF